MSRVESGGSVTVAVAAAAAYIRCLKIQEQVGFGSVAEDCRFLCSCVNTMGAGSLVVGLTGKSCNTFEFDVNDDA